MSNRLAVLAAAIVALVAVVVTTLGLWPTAAPPPDVQSGTTAFPVTVEAANGTVQIASRPERIVSLSPAATEILFAVGAGEQVVAVDQSSDYPAHAPRTQLSGLTPNAEAIVRFRPDLVVVSEDRGIVAAFRKFGIPILHQPAARDLDDMYVKIRRVGVATGHAREATRVVESMRADIKRLVEAAPRQWPSPRVFHELSPDLYTATSRTFIGQVYKLLGFANIADAADRGGSGYPQLSAEYVLAANPDLIVLADTKCCGQTPKMVAARPGWNNVKAVKEDRVIAVDDSIASRWGPRIVLFFRAVARAARR